VIITTSAHTSGLIPASRPTDIAIGSARARKPEMFGTTTRSNVAPSMRRITTPSAPSPSAGRPPTSRRPSHGAAPLATSAWASEIDAAMTKKFDQPTPRSRSDQASGPTPGVRSAANARSAGSAGSR